MYGGTDFFFNHVLPVYGIRAVAVEAGDGFADRVRALKLLHARVVYVETPANPTISMTDIAAVTALKGELGGTAAADRAAVAPGETIVVVDNTFLGALWRNALACRAGVSLYSATKFIGGHSDLIAGAAAGREDLLAHIKTFRTILGTMAEPFTAWLMLRSLETLTIRMEAQAANAGRLAQFLAGHPAVGRVLYPGLLAPGSAPYALFARQCSGAGSLIAFEVGDGRDKEAALRVLNRLRLAHLAVSLGGTETLVEHPAAMTHADVSDEVKKRSGIAPGLIRVSCGVERCEDLIEDFRQALDPEGCEARSVTKQ